MAQGLSQGLSETLREGKRYQPKYLSTYVPEYLRNLRTQEPSKPSTDVSGPSDYLLTSTVQVSNSSTASHRVRARGQHGKGEA